MKQVPRARQETRFVALFCDAETCGGESIATLGSYFDGLYEVWTVADGGVHERLVHHDDDGRDVDRLDELGMVAHRFKLVCPTCGYDITVADLLGMGVRSMANQRAGRPARSEESAPPAVKDVSGDDVWSERAVYTSPRRRELMTSLSRVADAGVSRIPLAAFGRILNSH